MHHGTFCNFRACSHMQCFMNQSYVTKGLTLFISIIISSDVVIVITRPGRCSLDISALYMVSVPLCLCQDSALYFNTDYYLRPHIMTPVMLHRWNELCKHYLMRFSTEAYIIHHSNNADLYSWSEQCLLQTEFYCSSYASVHLCGLRPVQMTQHRVNNIYKSDLLSVSQIYIQEVFINCCWLRKLSHRCGLMSLKTITPLPGLVYWDLFSFKAIVHPKLQLYKHCKHSPYDRFDYDGGEDFQWITVDSSHKANKLHQKTLEYSV